MKKSRKARNQPKGGKMLAGFEGRFEIGARKIDDPLEAGQRVFAAVNVRESAIDHLASHNRINTSQAAAGDRFRRLWEQAAIGGIKGMDATREAVSGHIADPITDQVVAAAKDLQAAMQAIGVIGSRVLMSIMEEGSIEKAATKWSGMGGVVKGRRAEGYITGTLVDALDGLTKHWRLEGKGVAKTTDGHYLRNGEKIITDDDIRAAQDLSETGPSYEITVGRFGDSERREIRPVDSGPMTVHSTGSAEGTSAKQRRRAAQSQK